MKNRTTAIVLTLLFGTFGIHSFYLGKHGKGFKQLLLTISGIGTVISFPWAVWDFFALLLTNEENFNNRYNKKQDSNLPEAVTSLIAPFLKRVRAFIDKR